MAGQCWQAARFVIAFSAISIAASVNAWSSADSADIASRLTAGYAGVVKSVDSKSVVFKDGATLPLDDGAGDKTFNDWLAKPAIKDMFRLPYPSGTAASAPARDFDPGRARNTLFFTKVYGDCRQNQVAGKLVSVSWLPKKYGRAIKITSVNGVADKLRAVSAELDQLPAHFNRYLFPIGGTYVCRSIAGTDALSAHGYGIAIDIAVKPSHYWRWPKVPADGNVVYRNAIPSEIVSVFEKHGFIWGGRWYHHDTMHFEYRPELLPPTAVDRIGN